MEHFERFRDLEDDELVLLAREDDDALTYLMLKYKNLVRAKARSYFLMGADSEDILQEGMMGLYKAIRDYKPEMSSFRGFAELCVTRQIISAVKTATRQKHMPLNSYVSLNKPVYDADDRTLLDVMPGQSALDPEEIILGEENRSAMEAHIKKELSEMERSVLELYLTGMSYGEIAERLDRPLKSIDNALQRIKTKLSGFLR
ncbi:RNA polymerase sporulation sigma factor SigH [Christensenella sp. MSJ-20]|nr:MAG: RNA polymerase sporulation sigma factor SigH [Bacillota bacterium]QWT56136.1 RNA polymerase sporulation sigma factor SigH [Christensenella sp. MSJ-20]